MTDLAGKKIIILTEQQFNDQEFWYPFYRLKEAGATVTVTGSGSADKYTGKAGTETAVDMSADSINPDQYDGIIIPGGFAPDFMRRYPAMVSLVKKIAEAGKVTASICHGGWMLASAGILKGKNVTSFFAIKDDLVNAGANWTDEEVVVDGNLITSRVPDDLPVFMKTVVKALQG